MQKTKALASFKGIFPLVHQPLPLTKRESNRLLNAITTSFRAQLDAEEHLPARDPAKSLAPSNPNFANLSSTSTAAPSTPSSTSKDHSHGTPRATNQHMNALLNNPLFKPAPKIGAPGDTESVARHKAIFEMALSRGLMTQARALGFLMQIQTLVTQSATLSLADGIQSTGAAVLVLRWLRSSGEERSLLFLRNYQFRTVLVKFMAIEGHDNVFWEWLERLMSRDSSLDEDPTSLLTTTLRHFVHCKAYGSSLEPGFNAILKAESLIKKHQWSPEVLRPAWLRLARQTTIYPTAPPSHLFDAFVSLGETVGSNPLELAHVALRHPLKPSPGLALEFLSRQAIWEGIKESRDKLDESANKFIERLLRLSLDTVQYLEKAEQSQEALRIWQLLEKHLGWLAGPRPHVS